MDSESECRCRCHLGGAFASCDVDAGTSGVAGVKYCGPHTSAEQPDASTEPLLTARDHWDAVDRLTRPSRTKLWRDDGTSQWMQLPSLLDQLYEAMESGQEGSTHGVPASKPPMDAAALSLLLEIATTIRDGARQRRYHRTMDNAVDLRALTSQVNATADPEQIHAAARLARSWVARIKTTISNDPDRTWRLHGAACTVCGSTRVPVYDADGTETHQPALIVHSTDGTIDRIECAFCGSTLTGPDLVDIVRRAPRHSATA